MLFTTVCCYYCRLTFYSSRFPVLYIRFMLRPMFLIKVTPFYLDMPCYVMHIHPTPKVMADFRRYKNQHDAFTQFAHFCVWTWWRHQMETFSALLAICTGNSPVPGEFPAQRPVTRSFDVFFDLHPKKRLSKQWWGWWFEMPSCPLWRHRNENSAITFGEGCMWLEIYVVVVQPNDSPCILNNK